MASIFNDFRAKKDNTRTVLYLVFIPNEETIEEAELLIQTDPAIKTGSLIMELHP